jgi:hypothetical protein
MTRKFDENAIAEVIVSVLPAGVAREFSSERGSIRYAVRGEGIKLKKIILNRDSLRKLANDPLGAVKIEYLQRDLLNAATQRGEFRYPRPLVHRVMPRFAAFMPLAVGR